MHPAIGILSSGKFYAYLDGHGPDKEPTYRDSVEELEALLAAKEGREVPAALAKAEPAPAQHASKPLAPRGRLKSYKVAITLKYPAIQHSGCELEVVAATKREAIRKAREEVQSQNLYDRHDGPLLYKVNEADDE